MLFFTKKTIANFLSTVFLVHFLIIFIYLLSGLFDLTTTRKITNSYAVPFFEQDWSMFSVPGESNKYILVQYHLMNTKQKKYYDTEWLDLSKPLFKYNSRYYFSISQRLMKYHSGCINNIYQIANMSIDSLNRNLTLKSNDSAASKFVFTFLEQYSSGYSSLRNYAAIVFKKIEIVEKQQYDSVSFALKIIDDAFPKYKDRKKDFFNKLNHNYTEFNIQHGSLF